MSKEIVFEQINVEDPVQKNRLQFEAKIFNMVNGKQIYADEETGFIFQKYSGFAPKAFIKEVKNRDFVKISLDPEQESCVKLENTLNEYDDSFESSRKTVFGKYDRLYKFSRSVKKPKSSSEEEISEDEDEEVEKESKETKETQPKFNSCKMKLKMDWFYYYQGERLDKSNTNIVKKAVTDSMNKNKNVDKDKRKALLSTLTFKLNFKDENDKTVQKDVKMDELEQKREIDTKVFYRRPQTLPPNAQEFLKKSRGTSAKEIDEYETELVSMFGDPQEPKDVRHPDDLDKYYNFNCWVRFLYSPYRVWASKTKDEDVEVDGKVIPGKRKSGIKYVINSIDIIQLPYENNFSSSHKTVYSKYAFGKRGNDELLINQSADTVFTAVEKSAQSVQSTESTSKADKTDKVEKVEKNSKSDKKDKKEKIQMKVESESEESESEESEDSSESEESESESESEPEPEPEPVKKGKGKTVVETAKSTKSKDSKKSK
jgi:hypothetical protein